MAKKRTVIVTLELETSLPVREIKETLKDAFPRGEVKQVQANVADATKSKG